MNNHFPLHWQDIDNTLVRVFIFSNFVQCVDFITKITVVAEQMHHHPDIEIFQYKHVRISLSTKDAGNTITEKDIQLAMAIDNLFSP